MKPQPLPQPKRPTPPSTMPFDVNEVNGVLRVILDKDAGQYTVLTLPHSYRWIRGAAVEVTIDLWRVRILNWILKTWLLRMISEGKPSSLIIANPNRIVLRQLREMGLSEMLEVPGDV